MNNPNFTTGPWEACLQGDYADYDGDCRVILGDDRRIAVAIGSDTESQSNANLIAAAPDMYAALELIIKRLNANIEDGTRPDQWSMEALVLKAREALAKARGENDSCFIR